MRANIYKANVQQLDRCTIKTELWMLFFVGFAVAVLFSTALKTDENPCDPTNAGTDYWFEVCMNEGEIDLTPIPDSPKTDSEPTIQDEAQTLTSMGRMEL